MSDIDGGQLPQPAGSDNAQSLLDVQTVGTPSTITRNEQELATEEDSLTMSITPAKSDSPETAAKSNIEKPTLRNTYISPSSPVISSAL